MRDHIFRKYDIRGIVGQDFNLDSVYDFGRALAFYFAKCNPHIRTIVVGMDGRLHSEIIKNDLIRALIESGLDVRFIGICPTPVLYFSLHTLAVDAGVMVTASHNDKEYNGFKICLGKYAVWGHELARLRDMYKRKARITLGREGLLSKFEATLSYVSWLEEAFSHLKKSNISAVIDCGNGVAGVVMPELVKRMEWKNISLLHQVVDGSFPHHAPDPTNLGRVRILAASLRRNKIDLGIGFDGDADRMVVMARNGKLVAGDRMLALFSESVLLENIGASVVFDSKCSQMLSELLSSWGAQCYRVPTGHPIIKQKMRESSALLAGEFSCHFMFRDRYFGYDDGLYSMLRLFEILEKTEQPLYDLLERFPKMYTMDELRIPCFEHLKEAVIEQVYDVFNKRSDVVIETEDGVRVIASYGWGILRASNTQPVISFRCESKTKDGFKRIKEDFDRALALSHTNFIPSRFSQREQGYE